VGEVPNQMGWPNQVSEVPTQVSEVPNQFDEVHSQVGDVPTQMSEEVPGHGQQLLELSLEPDSSREQNWELRQKNRLLLFTLTFMNFRECLGAFTLQRSVFTLFIYNTFYSWVFFYFNIC